MQRSLAASLVLLLPILLSGCAQSDADETRAPVVITATGPANKGILLRVLVITDEYFPVPKARVTLVGLGVNATTDDWGDAFFHLAQPGRYALHVHRHGFYPNQTRILIEEGTPEATARVRLLDAPHDANYSDYYFFNGLCGPTLYVRDATTNECTDTRFIKKPEARFILGRGLVKAYIELRWDKHPLGAQSMRMEARFPEIGAFANGQDAIVAEGTSPVRLLLPNELLTPKHLANGNTINILVGLSRGDPVATNVQQEFMIDAQFDYFVPAPDVDPDS